MGNLLELSYENVRPLYGLCEDPLDVRDYLSRYVENIGKLQAEEKYPEYFEAPIGCQMELTHRCNQRCLTCYNRSGEHVPADEVSPEEWKGIARQLVELGVFQVVISGGEPTLLGDDLFDIMDILHDSGVFFVFISNGMRIDDAFADRIAKYNFNWFQISMDGVNPEINDYVRGVKGAWQKAVWAAEAIRERGLPLSIAHTVTKRSISTYPAMVEFAYELGAVRFISGIYLYSGRAILNKAELYLTPEEHGFYNSVFKEMYRKFTLGRLMHVVNCLDEAVSFRLQTITPTDVILLRPNGDVKIDCALPFKIGNFRQASLKDIWTNHGKRAYKSKQLRDYVSKVKSGDDLYCLNPRPYVDADVLLDTTTQEAYS
jgi:MoaA/NifB/PqqE/SkfB family radical SAM enzyme